MTLYGEHEPYPLHGTQVFLLNNQLLELVVRRSNVYVSIKENNRCIVIDMCIIIIYISLMLVFDYLIYL